MIEGSTEPNAALMEVNHGLSSRTMDVQWTQIALEEYTGKGRLFIADAPGFNSTTELNDSDIVQRLVRSLEERCDVPPPRIHTDRKLTYTRIQQGEAFRLGFLHLLDISLDRYKYSWPTLQEDLAFLKSEVDPGILNNLTVITTKWPLRAQARHHDIDSIQEQSRSAEHRVEEFENRHQYFGAALGPLRVDACKNEGDEYRNFREAVDRVSVGNWSFTLESLRMESKATPAPGEVQRSFLQRFLHSLNCSCFSTHRISRVAITDQNPQALPHPPWIHEESEAGYSSAEVHIPSPTPRN